MYTVGFSGTQKGMTDAQKNTLEALLTLVALSKGSWEFHHGDCVGADEEVHKIVRTFSNVRIVGHPPIKPDKRAFCVFDEILPEKEYLARNRDIAKSKMMLICPKEFEEQKRFSGTWATYRYSKDTFRIVIYPDGTCIVG